MATSNLVGRGHYSYSQDIFVSLGARGPSDERTLDVSKIKTGLGLNSTRNIFYMYKIPVDNPNRTGFVAKEEP